MSFKEQHANYVRPEIFCGIYIITNLINNKKYIGKSNNIKRRFMEHRNPYEQKRTPNKPLYQAFSKYGIENFDFKILEECSSEKLNEREKYWISFYQTTNSTFGYNITDGGDGFDGGEKHPNHKITMQDVIDIRTAYNNRERRKEVEQKYLDKIGPSGFRKIWQGITWSDIMPEVYTIENKNFHSKNTGQKGSTNGRALLNEKQVYNIRLRKKNGDNWLTVYNDYMHTGIKKSSFQNIWQGHSWKNVVVK